MIKKNQIAVLAISVCFGFGQWSQAVAAKSSASSSSSASSYSGSDSGFRFGAGTLIGSGQIQNYSATGVSAMFHLNAKHSIQANLVLPSTSPFAFMIGGTYKYTVSQSRLAGFHIGGGLGLGSVNPALVGGAAVNVFAFNLHALAGIHFTLSDLSNVLFSVDAGPNLSIIDGGANFSFAFLGANVHYFF